MPFARSRLVAFSLTVGLAGCCGPAEVDAPPAAVTATADEATPAADVTTEAVTPAADVTTEAVTPDADVATEQATPDADGAGAATDAADPDSPPWIDDAVESALYWEIMPGTDGEPEPGRAEEVRAFFLAHPEYEDPALRQRMEAHACGLGGLEATHAYLADPPPKTPVIVDVETKDWRVLVAHADVHCTSDDWSWYSYDATEGAKARGAVTAYGNAENDQVVIRVAGAEVARVPLKGQGFLALRAGKDPLEIAYDPSAIQPALDQYFGPPVPASDEGEN